MFWTLLIVTVGVGLWALVESFAGWRDAVAPREVEGDEAPTPEEAKVPVRPLLEMEDEEEISALLLRAQNPSFWQGGQGAYPYVLEVSEVVEGARFGLKAVYARRGAQIEVLWRIESKAFFPMA